jgi:hypothetical protein
MNGGVACCYDSGRPVDFPHIAALAYNLTECHPFGLCFNLRNLTMYFQSVRMLVKVCCSAWLHNHTEDLRTPLTHPLR